MIIIMLHIRGGKKTESDASKYNYDGTRVKDGQCQICEKYEPHGIYAIYPPDNDWYNFPVHFTCLQKYKDDYSANLAVVQYYLSKRVIAAVCAWSRLLPKDIMRLIGRLLIALDDSRELAYAYLLSFFGQFESCAAK